MLRCCCVTLVYYSTPQAPPPPPALCLPRSRSIPFAAQRHNQLSNVFTRTICKNKSCVKKFNVENNFWATNTHRILWAYVAFRNRRNTCLEKSVSEGTYELFSRSFHGFLKNKALRRFYIFLHIDPERCQQ